MSTVIPLETGGYRVFTKGASEIIMSKCSFIFGEGGRIDKVTIHFYQMLLTFDKQYGNYSLLIVFWLKENPQDPQILSRGLA
jgi:magnesium-transporting ATPase (P-type)